MIENLSGEFHLANLLAKTNIDEQKNTNLAKLPEIPSYLVKRRKVLIKQKIKQRITGE